MKFLPALGIALLGLALTLPRTFAANRGIYFEGVGDYKYWKPVLYHAESVGAGGQFLKIELTGETQSGRVEIVHALKPK